MSDAAPGGPAVVALGGGHGLAAALRGIRRYTSDVTAVVSVADDGGSSGRLRRDLGVLPPGDLRRCLVALADDELWAHAFEHRFAAGELDGHALGNLLLVGLTDTTGDFTAALDAAGRLLRTVGRVLPATTEPVVLKAEVGDHEVEGQVAVQNSANIRRVELVPADVVAPTEAVAAIERADQVVLAPGSLYTSLLPVLCVDGLRAAIARTPATVVQVVNLRPQVPETAGLDATDHLRALRAHGVRVDVFLLNEGGELSADVAQIRAWGVEPVAAPVATDRGLTHDPGRLASALQALL
ncbi:MAG TPA: gluconeogenesis factor YvcK family protein [Acidimicrobiia bacterium]|nr:gluconeogenesis factor YvcK family protein [Acidimicrobiia bacterium]